MLCLLFLPNVPGSTFIQGATFIPESRVRKNANLSVFTLSFFHIKERSGWKTAPHTSLSSILLKKVWLHRRCVPCEIFGNPVFCVWLFYSASSPNHPPDFPKGISRVCMHSVLVGTVVCIKVLTLLNILLKNWEHSSKTVFRVLPIYEVSQIKCCQSIFIFEY